MTYLKKRGDIIIMVSYQKYHDSSSYPFMMLYHDISYIILYHIMYLIMSKIEFIKYPVINNRVIDIQKKSHLFITGYTFRTSSYQYWKEKVSPVQFRTIPSTYFYFERSLCCRCQKSHVVKVGRNLSNVTSLTGLKQIS